MDVATDRAWETKVFFSLLLLRAPPPPTHVTADPCALHLACFWAHVVVLATGCWMLLVVLLVVVEFGVCVCACVSCWLLSVRVLSAVL